MAIMKEIRYYKLTIYNGNNLNHDSESLKVSTIYVLRKDFNLALKSLEVPASTTCSGRLKSFRSP